MSTPTSTKKTPTTTRKRPSKSGKKNECVSQAEFDGFTKKYETDLSEIMFDIYHLRENLSYLVKNFAALKCGIFQAGLFSPVNFDKLLNSDLSQEMNTWDFSTLSTHWVEILRGNTLLGNLEKILKMGVPARKRRLSQLKKTEAVGVRGAHNRLLQKACTVPNVRIREIMTVCEEYFSISLEYLKENSDLDIGRIISQGGAK